MNTPGRGARRLVVKGVGAALALGASGVLDALAQTQPALPATVKWPPVRLLDGSVLPAEWSARGAIVVFWATWCPFCHRHNKHIQALQLKLPAQGPRILGVAVDGPPQKVRQFAQREGYTFPISDAAELLRPLIGVGKSLPTTCVVGPRGDIRQRIPGEMFEEDVFDLVKAAT